MCALFPILTFLFITTSLVSAVAIGTSTDTAVPLPPPITRSGTALQTITDIISNATVHIKPLNDQLVESAVPGIRNVDTVCNIVQKIGAVISTTVAELEAVPSNFDVAAIGGNTDPLLILGNLLKAIHLTSTTLLSIILAGDNTVEGSVIPLINDIQHIVGLVLLLLQNLGALGLLGPGGLLSSLLSTLTALSPT